MKRIIRLFSLLILSAVIVSACSHRPPLGPIPIVVAERKPDTAAFLAAFRRLDFDTLSVYTGYDNLQSNVCLMTGTLLDTPCLGILPGTFINEMYAVGRFDIGPDREAYLVRHWGEYDATRITLYLFDKVKRSFLPNTLQLAESWGDAGDYLMESSMIKRLSPTDIRIYIDEQSNYPDTTDEKGYRYINLDSMYVYRIENDHFVRDSSAELRRWMDEPLRPKTPDDIDTTAAP